MATDTEREYRETADRCRYQRLYRHLRDLDVQEWRTTFDEIERILEFKLPASARVYRQWWENQGNPNGRSQALAWSAAGWMAEDVDMGTGTLVFTRRRAGRVRKRTLEEMWPARSGGAWPQGLSLRRDDIYDDGV